MKGTRCFVVVAALSALLLLAFVSQSKAAEVTGEEERSCNASTTWDVAAGRELLEDAGAWVLERSLTEMLLMAILIWCMMPTCSKPNVPKFNGLMEEKSRRKHITALRAGSHLFPPPYPNGWYRICRTSDVRKGEVIPITAFGQEMVAFRGQNGKIGVLNAFCPHLGTHLGHGGTVSGNAIVCPYHSWSFEADGTCVGIPYCNRSLDRMQKRLRAKPYETREILGIVFVWYHADGEKPFYELNILREIQERNMVMVGDFEMKPWHMHIMEPAQNSTDWYHFLTVHRYLGARPTDRCKVLAVKHQCKTHMRNLGKQKRLQRRTVKLPDGVVDKGSTLESELLPATWICLEENVIEAKLFGVIPIPGLFFRHFTAEARFQGPQVSVFAVESTWFGAVHMVFTFTPQKPFLQQASMRAFKTRWFPQWMAVAIARHGMNTIEQDRPVWENKLTIAPRNLVAGDGPFAAFGSWIKQFYSDGSTKWGDDSLSW